MKNSVPPQEEQNKLEPVQIHVKSSFFSIIAAIALIFILIFAGRYYYTHYLVVETKHGTISVFDNSPTPLPTSIITPTPKQLKYSIMNTKTNEEVVSFANEYYSIEQWNDYLIYSESDESKNNIVVYNLKTYQTLRFNIKPLIYVREDGYYGGLHGIQIINNDLYISFGGYLLPGAIYYMPLPPTPSSNFTKLTDSRNASIKLINDRYFIIGGEGDGCGGERDYSLFDPETKTVTPLLTSHHGCSYGDEFLDFDQQNRMIIANRSSNPGGTEIGAGYTNLINYVYALDPSNPTEKVFLVTKEEMPEEMHQVGYLKDSNELAFNGKSIYIYNIGAKSFTQVENVPKVTPSPEIANEKLEDRLSLPSEFKIVKE